MKRVMFTRRLCPNCLFISELACAHDGDVAVKVTGAVKQPLTLSANELAKMPRPSVKATSNGMRPRMRVCWSTKCLSERGVPQGSALRGKALAGYVLAQAQDGC